MNTSTVEIIKASIRVCQEAAIFSSAPIIFDWTEVILIPRVILDRLMQAIENSDYRDELLQ